MICDPGQFFCPSGFELDDQVIDSACHGGSVLKVKERGISITDFYFKT